MFKYGFQRIIIPCFYRERLKDHEITDDFITDYLNRLRSLGEDISTGSIELVDILSSGEIEVYIER